MFGLWNFNGNGTDSSGISNNLTPMNSASFTAPPKFGGAALGLDGVDDFATVDDLGSLALSSSITVEAWVKMNAFPNSVGPGGANGFAPIAAKWDDISGAKRGYLLSIVNDGSVRFDISHTSGFACGVFANLGPFSCANANNALVISNAKLTLGTWYHIAGVFDASTKKLQVFVNGVADTSVVASASNIFRSNAPFMVGAADTGSVTRRFTNGSIDELHVWGRPLSAQELAFMANPATGAELHLPGLIDFDKSDNIFESEWNVGSQTPVMVLEFIVPNTAGTQIVGIDAAGPHFPGAVTGNSALDALITGKKDNGKTVEVHIDLNPKAKLNTKIQFDPGQH
jgi:hypothetical protein